MNWPAFPFFLFFLCTLGGCLGTVPDEGYRFEAHALLQVEGTFYGETAIFSWKGLGKISGHQVNELAVHEIGVIIGEREEAFFLDQETLEPLAWRAPAGSQSVLYAGPNGAALERFAVFAPLHWSNQNLPHGTHSISYLGLEGSLTISSSSRVRLEFPLGGPDPNLKQVFDYWLRPNTSIPSQIEAGYASKGWQQVETAWRMREAKSEPLETRPHLQESRIPSSSIMPLVAWESQPGSTTPTELRFSSRQAKDWAMQDSLPIRQFFERNPNAFLASGEFDTDSVGTAIAPIEIGRTWRMRWIAPGETLEFSVRWDVPIPGAPSELARHETTVASLEGNSLETVAGERLPMVSWDAAYSRCVAEAGTPIPPLSYEDSHRSARIYETVLGNRPQPPPAFFFCPGVFVLDAYNGLLWGHSL